VWILEAHRHGKYVVADMFMQEEAHIPWYNRYWFKVYFFPPLCSMFYLYTTVAVREFAWCAFIPYQAAFLETQDRVDGIYCVILERQTHQNIQQSLGPSELSWLVTFCLRKRCLLVYIMTRDWMCQANLWIAIFGFVGNYFWTHYFYTVLGAIYTFPSYKINHVSIMVFHYYIVN